MSAPRIKVVAQPRGTWLWRCTQHPHVLRAGEGVTTARSVPSWEAAMAEGLKHLRDWHPDAAQPFGDDFPCCTNPMQRAHNESREGC